MVIPSILLLFVFAYVPMFGVIAAFQDFKLEKGYLGSEFVGLKHFAAFFGGRDFIPIMWNTLWISILKLIFVFPAPIILALLLNEIRFRLFKRVTQTVTYLPNFLSWVIVAGMFFSILAVDNGDINQLLKSMGLISKPINFFSEPFWFKPILIFTNVWKTMGFGSIVYLAAISSIDPTLYEAAQMDGLNRIKQIWYITLPSILPIIVIFLVLTLASILTAGFDDILLLTKQGTNIVLRGTSEVIDTYVYRVAFRQQIPNFSYGAAAGLFKASVSVILLWLGNRTARKLTGAALW